MTTVVDTQSLPPASAWYALGDLVVCNCAGCGRILADVFDVRALRKFSRHVRPRFVRTDDRPYCESCASGNVEPLTARQRAKVAAIFGY